MTLPTIVLAVAVAPLVTLWLMALTATARGSVRLLRQAFDAQEAAGEPALLAVLTDRRAARS